MTYDVQRWDLPGPFFEAHMIEGGRWVLVEDAEAHEKAAVKAAIVECAIALAGAARRREREQAIRDCIAAVPHDDPCNSAYNATRWTDNETPCICHAEDTITALSALLEMEKQ